MTIRQNSLYQTLIIASFLFCISTVDTLANEGNPHRLLSLQNLERERAALINEILRTDTDLQTKSRNIARRQSQLSDMERMVMRDERLISSGSDIVKKAFDNYETTFLVHAGAEHKRTAVEHWLSQVKLSNQNVFDTQIGFR